MKITLRLDESVVKFYRAVGGGDPAWMNRVLATYAQKQIAQVRRVQREREEVACGTADEAAGIDRGGAAESDVSKPGETPDCGHANTDRPCRRRDFVLPSSDDADRGHRGRGRGLRAAFCVRDDLACGRFAVASNQLFIGSPVVLKLRARRVVQVVPRTLALPALGRAGAGAGVAGRESRSGGWSHFGFRPVAKVTIGVRGGGPGLTAAG